MVESNKILTVSYGTFSCTLEGFDDAFETMKAIAEYFRDLTAEDRFFGAEPPTPDPELLTRLAERSSARRIEARRSGSGEIVLRQHSSAGTPVPYAPGHAAPDNAPNHTAPAARVVHNEPAARHSAAPEPAIDAGDEIEDVPAAPVQPSGESVAEKLERIRNVVRRNREAEAATPPATTADAPKAPDRDGAAQSVSGQSDADTSDEQDDSVHGATDQNGVAATDVPLDDEAPQPLAADATDVTAPASLLSDEMTVAAPDFSSGYAGFDDEYDEEYDGNLDTLPAAFVPDALVEDVLTQEDATPEDMAAEDAAPEDVAQDATAEDTAPEDVALQDVASEDATPEDVAQDAAAEDASSEGAALQDAAAEDAAPKDMAQDAAAEDAALEDVALQDVAEDATPEDVAQNAGPEDEAPVNLALEDAAEEEDADTLTPAIAEDESAFADTIGAAEEDESDDTDPAGNESLFAPAAEESAAPPRIARVIKVRREDFEQVFGAAKAAMTKLVATPVQESTVQKNTAASSLTAEEEAELQSELDAVRREIASGMADGPQVGTDDWDEDRAEDNSDDWDEEGFAASLSTLQAEDADFFDHDEDNATFLADDDSGSGAQPAPAEPRFAEDRSDGDMDRILAETNHQLGESEGSRRRSAIAHLRAAVAATRAEKQAGSDLNPQQGDDSTGVYRDDLAQVVRPRRPVAGAPSTERPMEERPAPLRLVAEQRIDTGALPAGPIRPRRVSLADIVRRDDIREADQAPRPATAPAIDETPTEDKHAAASARHAGSFAEYARGVGATSLPDLLEAAACYMAFVEGRDQFSRPQLMTKVRQVEQRNFSREDGLRTFGQLLRQGKLRRIEGGGFSVSDRTAFRPGNRAAG